MFISENLRKGVHYCLTLIFLFLLRFLINNIQQFLVLLWITFIKLLTQYSKFLFYFFLVHRNRALLLALQLAFIFRRLLRLIISLLALLHLLLGLQLFLSLL
ncbi:hypothetical protein IMG5_167350 [Ichthyophthirius multifiliis]|uniref:Transmembrane protein n=1 Tax=Ichthyophthirius multifiliis TaxID=5932 RepID=G0R0X1_ICHMU|nr:hypothetical protein IMG5_167350 [Ichthyophthirius multifiliis]EGR28882.1 hypothetical protein IMG5_167350 [Ichthyophthirius multifiliis]|eukprot:XP_004030118.1 hypothetical protein IMG5_167350 [Ichthyophthirius multifiliis]